VWNDPNLVGSKEIAGHASDGTTLVLMAIALAVGVSGIVGAYLFYGRGPSKTVDRWIGEGWFAPIYRASKAKLWFDEVYDVILVRPFKVAARGLFEIVDRFVIDTVAVNGAAFVIGIFGRISRWFQNGNVQRYLVGVMLGGALVFLITDCRHKATFEYTIVGNEIRLHAEPGSGIAGESARVYWDLDGDGKKDTDAAGKLIDRRDVTVTSYDGPITMWVEDPVSRREVKVTKTINLNEARAGRAATVPPAPPAPQAIAPPPSAAGAAAPAPAGGAAPPAAAPSPTGAGSAPAPTPDMHDPQGAK